MDQWWRLHDDGSMLNRTIIRKLGVVVAEVTEHFTRSLEPGRRCRVLTAREVERAMSALRWIGEMLRPLRPGVGALTSSRLEPELGAALTVTSPVFRDGDAIPRVFTADAEGRFPGLAWEGLPPQTQSVVLLVEDADIPLFRPVTHLIVHSIAPELGRLEPGSVPKRLRGPSPAGWSCGRNFLGVTGWTPPAPPPGHGEHRYAFQVFALNARPSFPYPPSRSGLMRRIRPHLVAQGRLIGTYKRV